MGGRAMLEGGPDPMLVKSGSREAIIADCIRYIRALGGRGGYILGDGASAAPGTPVHNLNAMLDAAKQAGSAWAD